MKCLSDKKVRHDGNNEDDPEYDKCQISQLKNDCMTMQLTVMGYDCDLLKIKMGLIISL